LRRKNQRTGKKLQLIFKIEKIEHLQRVGGKKSKEMHLGNYAIQKELSHGGMGKVFIAQDKYTEQIVALKVLPIHLALNANYTTRFARETQILQKLSHPGIIKVIDVGRDSTNNGDVYFYAMEYIEGRPLSELIHEEGLSTQTAGQIVMEIALALDYIHQHGVVHRDVKPNNIMIRKDKSAVLIDFGIARDTSVRRRRYRGRYISTREEISHYVGTLPYMSPEQISSKHYIDYRTDIYSLGVTLYEALTQERPFKGSGQTISRSILNWYPPEPSKINGDIPHDLDIIVMRALEKSKKKRYENGAEFAEDLHRWLHEQPILSSRARWWIRAWRKIRGCFRWI
jgi:serine/threonine protein kinase